MVGGLGGQGVEHFGRREVLGSRLNHPLPFLEPVHECEPDEGVVGCVERFEPQQGSSDPFDGSMILLDAVVDVFHLPDDDVGPMRLIVAFDRGFIGVTPINGARLRDPVPADGLLEKPSRGRLVSVFREQQVNGLPVRIYRTIPVPPLAFDADVRFIHPPADLDGPPAAVERLFERRAVCDHPPVDGRVIHVDPTFLHECFDMARAQWIRHRPADAGQHNLLGKVGTFAAHRHGRAPSGMQQGHSERHTPKRLQMKNATELSCSQGAPRPTKIEFTRQPYHRLACSTVISNEKIL